MIAERFVKGDRVDLGKSPNHARYGVVKGDVGFLGYIAVVADDGEEWQVQPSNIKHADQKK